MRQVPVYTIAERKPARGEVITLLCASDFYGSLDVKAVEVEYSWEPDDEDCGTSYFYEGQTAIEGYHLAMIGDHHLLLPDQEYVLGAELFNCEIAKD